ncbi:MAG: hypothetical protein FJX31_08590 [Alphaproteobacteria bacterium]|nr:hypothetical protein [Alphaproteobacteria bacterium]
MTIRTRLTLTALIALAAAGGVAGCKSRGELVVDEGVGVTAVRSRCPAVGVPSFTGDVTLFGGGGQKTADNIDVVAVMTNVRSQCSDAPDQITSSVTFEVQARRADARGARQMSLPYFVTVLRGSDTVVSKRVGQVTVSFADGQERATASGTGVAYIDAAEATLPEDIRQKITRKRRAGDADAAIDPLSEPDVKAALARAEFEVLIGFQLNQDQLAYNATR